MENKNCEWKKDEDSGAFETQCGGLFEIVEGTPIENNMVYCPYCGKTISGA